VSPSSKIICEDIVIMDLILDAVKQLKEDDIGTIAPLIIGKLEDRLNATKDQMIEHKHNIDEINDKIKSSYQKPLDAIMETCPICLDPFLSSYKTLTLYPCGHYLHDACYNQLGHKKTTCSICKLVCDTYSIHRSSQFLSRLYKSIFNMEQIDKMKDIETKLNSCKSSEKQITSLIIKIKKRFKVNNELKPNTDIKLITDDKSANDNKPKQHANSISSESDLASNGEMTNNFTEEDDSSETNNNEVSASII
jgi:hypothetical protein